jgi:hypothetical protein
VLVVGLLIVSAFAEADPLKVAQGIQGAEMEYSTITKTRTMASVSADASFGQIANKAYRRAPFSAATPSAYPVTPEAEGKCLQYADDLCHTYNGDCAGCLAVQGCGYCNDARQCLPSNGDNPGIEGCHCEVWLNEPKQCIEDVCAVVEGCQECSQKPYCVWCPHENLCMPGGFFGISGKSSVECKDWRWLRCEGTTGKTVLIIAGSTAVGIIFLFFASCVVYHKCYNPVRHSAHMHDELVESLLEDERTILSGHAHESAGIIDPALDLKGDSRDLNEIGPDNSTLPEPDDMDDAASTADELSQSEVDEDMPTIH